MQAILWPANSRHRGNEKNSVPFPELVQGFVCFLGFAEPKIVRPAGERVDQVKRTILDVHETLQELLEAQIAPDRGQKRAAGCFDRGNLVPPEV